MAELGWMAAYTAKATLLIPCCGAKTGLYSWLASARGFPSEG